MPHTRWTPHLKLVCLKTLANSRRALTTRRECGRAGAVNRRQQLHWHAAARIGTRARDFPSLRQTCFAGSARVRGMHAIHYAAYRGDQEALRGYLSAGTSPDYKTLAGLGVGFAHGSGGKTPLHCVCCFDTDEEIRTLGAQHIQLGGDMSIERAYAACCRDLVEAGADVNAVDVDGDSVLHYAVAKASTCD